MRRYEFNSNSAAWTAAEQMRKQGLKPYVCNNFIFVK